MAIGDIGTQIDTLEWRGGSPGGATYGPQWLKVPGVDFIVVVYAEANSKGEITTIGVDADGNIDAAITAEAYFENVVSGGQAPSLVNLGETRFFAVAFYGGTLQGKIATFSIGTDGSISSVIATLEFDTPGCLGPKLLHLAGTKYVLVYRYTSGTDQFGRVTTVNIDNDGTNLSIVDGPDNFAANGLSTGNTPQIHKVASGVYGILYQDRDDDDIKLKTIAITDAGIMSAAGSATTIFTLASGTDWTQLIALGNQNFVAACRKSAGDVEGKSFNITTAGVIGAVLDTATLMSGNGASAIHLLKLIPSYFSIAGEDASTGAGWMYTYNINTTTGVFSAAIDSFNFETVDTKDSHVGRLAPGIYANLWVGDTQDSVISTFAIEDGISPADALVRVTGIVGRWAAGPNPEFSMELLLGGLYSQYFSPVNPITTPEPTMPQVRQPARDILSTMRPTLTEHIMWMAGHTQEEQRRYFPVGVITFQRWQDWVMSLRAMGKEIP